jgi:lipopolysaccharide export system permease protein
LIAKLDKLILRTFIGPFIATFFIALFVVVLQFFWKYIDEMVGKGIGIGYLLELVGIVAIQTGVLFALPIAILLSSLMTFGNLAESFELLAIKSSGISLLRFMRPLFVFVTFVCLLAFLFNNYIIPRANLRFFTVLTDMRHAKPSFDLKEGAFYTGISNFAIQVDKKNDETGELSNVVIFENNGTSFQDNFIVAEKGKMSISPDKKGLDFILYNGERVQEKGKALSQNTDFVRIRFKELKKTFDISDLIMKRTADSVNKSFYKMLNITQLDKNMDSLKKTPDRFVKKMKMNLSGNMGLLQNIDDTTWKNSKTIIVSKSIKSIKDMLPDSVKANISSVAAEKINAAKNQLDMDLFEYKAQTDALRYHKVEWHKKFSLSIISLIMFLIGAPLGSIIKRGGLGTPLVWAIVFFVIYFVLLSSGEKSANIGQLTAFTGIWLPIFILLPVGIWFVVKARKDQNVIATEHILLVKGFFIKIFQWFKKLFSKKIKASIINHEE